MVDATEFDKAASSDKKFPIQSHCNIGVVGQQLIKKRGLQKFFYRAPDKRVAEGQSQQFQFTANHALAPGL
jgi:hypothetical protein